MAKKENILIQKSLKERTPHAGIFGLFAVWLQNRMKGLHRGARLICEIHACPPASAEIRQNVPAKLSTLLSGGTDFHACRVPRSTAIIGYDFPLVTIIMRYLIQGQLEIDIPNRSRVTLHCTHHDPNGK
jgi:hypothetical protein